MRARISVLSELPRDWRAAIDRWSRLNRKHRSRVEGAAAPTRNDEYLLYQTLLGAWPIEARPAGRRISRTASSPTWTRRSARHRSTRAGRTRMRRTTRPSTQFVRAILDPKQSREFLDDFAAMRSRVCRRRDVHLARAAAPEADRARRAGHLPGHRALGLQPGRPGQPPPGRLPSPHSPTSRRWADENRRRGWRKT